MKQTKNRFNLIYFTLDPLLTAEIKKVNQHIDIKREGIFSKKYNTNSFKVKVYDKVSTPFIDTTLFEDEQ